MEHIPKVEAEPSAHHVLAPAGQIVGEADAWAEVLVVVVRNPADIRIGDRAVKRNQLLVSAAVLDLRTANHIEILVPTKAEVERQTRLNSPSILAVETELFGGHQEVRVPVGDGHFSN